MWWDRISTTCTSSLRRNIISSISRSYDKLHPEMGYRSCLGITRLAGQYSPARMEAAAERALVMGACRYQSVKSILKNSLDMVPPVELLPSPPPAPHDNIRGAEYFD